MHISQIICDVHARDYYTIIRAEHAGDADRRGNTFYFQDNDDAVIDALPAYIRHRIPFVITKKAAVTEQVQQLFQALRRRFIPISTGVDAHTLIRQMEDAKMKHLYLQHQRHLHDVVRAGTRTLDRQAGPLVRAQ